VLRTSADQTATVSRVAKYAVVSAQPFDARLHSAQSRAGAGECTLHTCGEPAVMTMVGEDRRAGK
jgi:hypothetical protein